MLLRFCLLAVGGSRSCLEFRLRLEVGFFLLVWEEVEASDALGSLGSVCVCVTVLEEVRSRIAKGRICRERITNNLISVRPT